jgi:hypothetical protein
MRVAEFDKAGAFCMKRKGTLEADGAKIARLAFGRAHAADLKAKMWEYVSRATLEEAEQAINAFAAAFRRFRRSRVASPSHEKSW